jgi:hypothetical protein
LFLLILLWALLSDAHLFSFTLKGISGSSENAAALGVAPDE